MTDKPLIISGPMVCAILDGRETRTRTYQTGGGDPTDPHHLARRLANSVDAAVDGQCWVWQRHRNNHGYGKLTIAGKGYYAHRLAYELAKGAIPAGLHVMHSCDNPACINPDHLEVGTRSKNMSDCHGRGRSKIPTPRMKGEANGASRLTDRQVSLIRAALASGQTQQRIADRYSVSQTAISKIARGVAWSG